MPPEPDFENIGLSLNRTTVSALMTPAFRFAHTAAFHIAWMLYLLWVSVSPGSAQDASIGKPTRHAPSLIEYRGRINPAFKLAERRATKFIIVHTSEADLETTLKIVSLGKQNGAKWVSRGGHAHYVIDPLGHIYRILDEKYRAHHAGLSMWDGYTHLNDLSIGIELVAYHDDEITASQYRSVGWLIQALKDKYRLDDLSVLTHSQVAYARPNRWVAVDHRGRKQCARNFSRTRSGIGPTYPYDPDVRAGRLQADDLLSAIYYPHSNQPKRLEIADPDGAMRTAQAIAGDHFSSADTIYRLPGGFFVSGNRVGERIGWNRVPNGTLVYVD